MRLVLACAIVTQLAVTSFVVLRDKPPRTVAETSSVTTIPISISIPITVATAAPTPPESRPRCPAPRTDAPRAAKLTDLPQEVHGVAASRTNAGWIAAWNFERVLVSRDAGRTFERVLDGPGQVAAVTFDCYGNVIALRGQQLGIREGTREYWRAVPGLRGKDDDPIALVGGGPDVVVIGSTPGDGWQARLAVSPDLGRTWWYRDLVDAWESAEATGYQAADGSIHVALTTADCMSDPVYWLRIRDGKVETDDIGSVGTIALEGDVAYIHSDGEIQTKRFGEASWRRARGKRGEKLLAGSVDPAGRVWSIDETRDGEMSWVVAKD